MAYITASPHYQLSIINQFPRKRGFTLVELLVVIAIIGILMSLILPAVNSIREAARRTQCSNNIRNLAQGCLTAETEYGKLPSGGWAYVFTGDPDCGYGPAQPGGWTYAILPYIEQQGLYLLGQDYETRTVSDTQKEGARKRCQTPLPIFSCPTRRSALQYPYTPASDVTYRNARIETNVDLVGKTDYAACSGANNGGETERWIIAYDWNQAMGFEDNGWPEVKLNGLIYQRSAVSDHQITDGRSNTYLLGEKYLRTDVYLIGTDPADNECVFSGYNNDNHRHCYYGDDYDNRRPYQDREGNTNTLIFGSAHDTKFCMAFADNSIRWIAYTIDPELHSYLGNRQDGKRALPPD